MSSVLNVAPCALRLVLAATLFVNAEGYVRGRSRQVQCPMDYDAPRGDGKPGNLHIESVANFMEPKVQDTWWNEPHIEEYYKPSGLYKIAKSSIAGCGLIAAQEIKAGTKIGEVWVKDPDAKGAFADLVPRHFTPWFGRAVNHCPNSNSHLEEEDDGSVWTVATVNIEAGSEITGNYNEAAKQFPHLVEGAPMDWQCPKTY
eukprot:gnl/MRDRNA2_/MRDRNA2_29069_c0_seq1.p1 gnl/MRDRNA2_/MRDRNA2_29069_c0~~gnl/MRDRNA2_/MRDRNA2_29069_c0_seq1.p1  ORF type:complete len:201 (+),score=34.29 gnl/MRDRNA2_/MRDRNA2_29069_c0_seq1:74-676(+)